MKQVKNTKEVQIIASKIASLGKKLERQSLSVRCEYWELVLILSSFIHKEGKDQRKLMDDICRKYLEIRFPPVARRGKKK